jgi:hypothetical protein
MPHACVRPAEMDERLSNPTRPEPCVGTFLLLVSLVASPMLASGRGIIEKQIDSVARVSACRESSINNKRVTPAVGPMGTPLLRK